MARYVITHSMEKLPGTWKPTTDGSALVTCPYCNTTMHLQHDIEGNGDVNPSLDCPVVGCDFHTFVTLNEWAAHSVAAEGV